MNTKPLVSIILPAFNAEKYLLPAIESLLAQTYLHIEVIVIDDSSQDKTLKILQTIAKKDKRVVVVHNQENLKLSKTLNKAISLAHGKYLARMDADDWSYPDRIEKQVAFLEKHPEVGIVGGSMEVCDEQLRKRTIRKYHTTDQEIRKHLFFYSPFSHPLIMIRKSILEKAGDYNPIFNPAEDYELYFRLGRYGQFANLSDVLLKYRVIPKSMTTGGTRAMEMKTIQVRFAYAKEYQMTFFSYLYTLLHQLSLYLVPSQWKMRVFEILRGLE